MFSCVKIPAGYDVIIRTDVMFVAHQSCLQDSYDLHTKTCGGTSAPFTLPDRTVEGRTGIGWWVCSLIIYHIGSNFLLHLLFDLFDQYHILELLYKSL